MTAGTAADTTGAWPVRTHRSPMIFARTLSAALFFAFLAGCAAVPVDPWAAAERRPGAVAPIAAAMREEAWLVPGGPAPDATPTLLKARVFRPPGNGPFPAVVINHGSPGDPLRRTAGVPSFRAASKWFVDRGYMVVLPLRRGYGESGTWPESSGSCSHPDYVGSGRAIADDLDGVVRYLRDLPMVKPDRVLLVGQSAGGLGVIAAASRNPPGVFGAVNIAGGRGGREGGKADNNCAPERLVAANEVFGRTAKVPTLWLYTENDSYFNAELSRAMVSAYGDAGGRAVYILLPPFKTDGHTMFGDADGLPHWTPYVTAFLEALE